MRNSTYRIIPRIHVVWNAWNESRTVHQALSSRKVQPHNSYCIATEQPTRMHGNFTKTTQRAWDQIDK